MTQRTRRSSGKQTSSTGRTRATSGASATDSPTAAGTLQGQALRNRVLTTYRECLAAGGRPPGVRTLAKMAGCSHTYIYDNLKPELDQIAREVAGQAADGRVPNRRSFDDVEVDNTNLKTRNQQLREENQRLKKRLAKELGAEAAALLAPDDNVDSPEVLRKRIAELEAQVKRLELSNFDLSEELRALKLRAQLRTVPPTQL